MANVRRNPLLSKEIREQVGTYSLDKDFATFIDSFDLLCRQFAMQPADKAALLPSLLTGTAREIYGKLTAAVQADYPNMVAQLRDRFMRCGTNRSVILHKLHNRKMLPTETFLSFVDDIRQLVKALHQDPPAVDGQPIGPALQAAMQRQRNTDREQSLILHVINNATAPMRERLLRETIDNEEALIRIGMQFEAATPLVTRPDELSETAKITEQLKRLLQQAQHQTAYIERRPPYPQSRGSQSPQCFKCLNYGHRAVHCRMPQRRQQTRYNGTPPPRYQQQWQSRQEYTQPQWLPRQSYTPSHNRGPYRPPPPRQKALPAPPRQPTQVQAHTVEMETESLDELVPDFEINTLETLLEVGSEDTPTQNKMHTINGNDYENLSAILTHQQKKVKNRGVNTKFHRFQRNKRTQTEDNTYLSMHNLHEDEYEEIELPPPLPPPRTTSLQKPSPTSSPVHTEETEDEAIPLPKKQKKRHRRSILQWFVLILALGFLTAAAASPVPMVCPTDGQIEPVIYKIPTEVKCSFFKSNQTKPLPLEIDLYKANIKTHRQYGIICFRERHGLDKVWFYSWNRIRFWQDNLPVSREECLQWNQTLFSKDGELRYDSTTAGATLYRTTNKADGPYRHKSVYPFPIYKAYNSYLIRTILFYHNPFDKMSSLRFPLDTCTYKEGICSTPVYDYETSKESLQLAPTYNVDYRYQIAYRTDSRYEVLRRRRKYYFVWEVQPTSDC